MANLTAAQATRVNDMCPIINEYGLGTRIRNIELALAMGTDDTSVVLGTASTTTYGIGSVGTTPTLSIGTAAGSTTNISVSGRPTNIKGTLEVSEGTTLDTTLLVKGVITGGVAGTAAGELDLIAPTAANGRLIVKAVNAGGAFNTTISNGTMGQASVVTIPDPGAGTANFVLDAGVQTIGGAKTFSAAMVAQANITAGLAGTIAGQVTCVAPTAANGNLILKAVNAGGAFDTTISSGTIGQSSIVTIPDPGAATAKFVLDTGTQEIAQGKTFLGNFYIGKDGTAGTATIYPSTASSGSTRLQMADNTGDTVTVLQIAAQAGARTLTIPDGAAATANFLLSEGPQSIAGSQTFTAGAATPAVALRFGDTVNEGLELKVYEETLELTNAVTLATNCVIPAGAVILSAQANLQAIITGDASGDNLLAAVGLGIVAGDEDKYGNTTNLTANQKIDTIPDWAVNGGETLAIFGLQADGNTAATEKFTGGAGQDVRVRVTYLAPNSLNDA